MYQKIVVLKISAKKKKKKKERKEKKENPECVAPVKLLTFSTHSMKHLWCFISKQIKFSLCVCTNNQACAPPLLE